MLRRAVAVVALLCLNSAVPSGQGPEFKVESASASVYQGPSVATRVIGQAPRGAVLAVVRELGSWVRVTWPEAPDGIGYLHVSAGSTTGGSPTGVTSLVGTASTQSQIDASASRNASADAAVAPSVQPGYVVAPSHVVGLGAQMGNSAFGSGLSARTWMTHRLGLQLEVLRSPLTEATAVDRFTTVQFAPAALYALPSLMTDYVWVRPYMGAGPRWLRQSMSVGPQGGPAVSENSLAFQAFGGGEFTFASLPRFTFSTDVRYGWVEKDSPASDFGGVGFSVSAHWYLK